MINVCYPMTKAGTEYAARPLSVAVSSNLPQFATIYEDATTNVEMIAFFNKAIKIAAAIHGTTTEKSPACIGFPFRLPGDRDDWIDTVQETTRGGIIDVLKPSKYGAAMSILNVQMRQKLRNIWGRGDILELIRAQERWELLNSKTPTGDAKTTRVTIGERVKNIDVANKSSTRTASATQEVQTREVDTTGKTENETTTTTNGATTRETETTGKGATQTRTLEEGAKETAVDVGERTRTTAAGARDITRTVADRTDTREDGYNAVGGSAGLDATATAGTETRGGGTDTETTAATTDTETTSAVTDTTREGARTTTETTTTAAGTGETVTETTQGHTDTVTQERTGGGATGTETLTISPGITTETFTGGGDTTRETETASVDTTEEFSTLSTDADADVYKKLRDLRGSPLWDLGRRISDLFIPMDDSPLDFSAMNWWDVAYPDLILLNDYEGRLY